VFHLPRLRAPTRASLCVLSLSTTLSIHAAHAAPTPTPAPAPAPAPTPAPTFTDPDLDALRKAAGDEAGPTTLEAPPPAGGSLNITNPEISAVIDAAAVFIPKAPYVTSDQRSGFFIRELELSFVSWIDHLARFKGFVSFNAEGAEIEELTVFWPGLLGPINVTAGRFRQSLDPVNRWHAHALDQADLPLVHQRLLGDEGLAQTGLRFDTVFGTAPALTHLVQVEITNSENEALFAGEMFSAPSFLGHLSNHLALGDDGYLELGGGALVGWKNRTGDAAEVAPDSGATGVVAEPSAMRAIYWGDFTAAYDPPGGRDRFAFFLRGALFYRDGDSAEDSRMGGYAYVHAQLDRTSNVGVRGDWVAAGDGQPEIFALAPVLTFWQSEYLYLRLQYQLGLPDGEDPTHAVVLQLNAGIGPHYHDRY